MATGPAQIGKHFRHARRLTQIAQALARHGLWAVLEETKILSWLSPDDRKKVEEEGATTVEARDESIAEQIKPHRLRLCFEELGPTFVKLGQILATREDLIPQDYTDELAKLHSSVAELPFSVIETVLKEELGDEKLSGLGQISEKPLAAGSIAQVHRVTNSNGDLLVLKVQRPGLRSLIQADLGILELAAGLLEKYVPESLVVSPKNTVDELSKAILGELDFIREAANTEKVAKNFASKDEIVIPKVHWDYTTHRVLALDFIQGVPVWDRAGLLSQGNDTQKLVSMGLEMFMEMVFVHGEYHGDLHSGNLLALRDGKLAVIDFGVTARISRKTRENLAGLLVAIVEQDFEKMTRHFMEITTIRSDFDFDRFQADLSNAMAPFIGLPLNQVRSGKILWELATIAAEHRAPLPRELILFLKTMASFEGIGARLDPDFDIFEVCQTFAQSIVERMYSREELTKRALLTLSDLTDLARQSPFQLKKLLTAAGKGELSVKVESQNINTLSYNINQASSRVAVSIIIGSLVIGSSILTYSGVNLTLGIGGFVAAGVLGLYVIFSILRGDSL